MVFPILVDSILLAPAISNLTLFSFNLFPDGEM